ncbi:MAG: class I SAM-dependent methyltransferase [Actinomycetota bacterium]|nr:class I SAM-dependent methyltransferase [Actinomycetota bacterium]
MGPGYLRPIDADRVIGEDGGMVARYDAVADVYGAGEDHYEGAAVAALLALVGPAPGPRALDVACGHGLVARELARRGAAVTGIDVSERLLDKARATVGPSIEYVLGDATDDEVLAGCEFELVTSNFGLSDIDDLDGLCHTVARVLVPGGRFVFSILHPCFGGGGDVSSSWPSGGTYRDEGWWRADGERSTLRQEVGANHRTLSTYVNTLISHGLVVERLVEPAPEPEWAATRPKAAAQPVYLVVACRRAPIA